MFKSTRCYSSGEVFKNTLWKNVFRQQAQVLFDRMNDAEGNKVQKQVTENGQTQTTDYLGGFQYLNAKLDFLPHAEGYVKAVNTGSTTEYHYVYHYTDHLGNIRLSYGRDPETNEVAILKESHYYPFGLTHKGYVGNHRVFEPAPEGRVTLTPVRNYLDDSYRYTFGGKEEQPELGLNWIDHHARNYDAALGRWMSPDPLAEEYSSWSPYNFVMNSPLRFIDPTGMFIELPTKPGEIEGEVHFDEDTGASYTWDGEGGWHSDMQGVEELDEVFIANESSSYGNGDQIENEGGNTLPEKLDIGIGALGVFMGVKNELIEFAGKSGELSSGAMKYLKFSKGLGYLGAGVTTSSAAIEYWQNPTAGNAARVVVQGLTIGTVFIPGVGWAISLSMSTADMIWGNQFYEWIDN